MSDEEKAALVKEIHGVFKARNQSVTDDVLKYWLERLVESRNSGKSIANALRWLASESEIQFPQLGMVFDQLPHKMITFE